MGSDRPLNALRSWLDARTGGAPPVLRARLLEHVRSIGAERGVAQDGAALLARAGMASLEAVAAHPGDRSVALDLLAADGLITLALLHRAETDPAGLATFARALTEAEAP